MDPLSSTQILGGGRRVATADLALRSQASFRAAPEEVPALRKTPDEPGGIAVHPSLLRHADEQTVVGLAAVLRAIRREGLDPAGFGDWSVLVAPRYLGRAAFERAFPTFRAESAWGVSPHLIPAHSLHSPSGTISQAIKAHGPNLGVGGTPGGDREALLCASTWLLTGSTPGVWVVLTGRATETDGIGPAGDYEALALAIVPSTIDLDGPRLQVSPEAVRARGLADSDDRALSRWLAPGALRLDEGGSGPAIPRPHFRPPGSGDQKR